MLESFLQRNAPPKAGKTETFNMKALKLGGPPYNVCWYLSKFGMNPKLVGFAGRQQKPIVIKAMRNAKLGTEGLRWHTRQGDLLFAVLTPNEHYSYYVRSNILRKEARTLMSICRGADVVILSGSRHAALRTEMAGLSESYEGRLLAFNPSYAIEEFSAAEFGSIFRRATVVILNQHEAGIACDLLAVPAESELVNTTNATVIVTQGARGAEIWWKDGHVHVNTFVSQVVSTVGSGDAFFAGFLYAQLHGESTLRCGQFGMTLAAYVVESAETRVEAKLTEVESRMQKDFKLEPTE